MIDDEQEATAPRRWSAFVCPHCRFVFRIARDHDGKGIVCPSCHHVLRIPDEGEEFAPLMAPMENIDKDEHDEPHHRGEKRTRSKRKKKAKEAKTPDWDASAGKWKSTRKKGKYSLRSIATWSLSIAAVFGITYFVMKSYDPKDIAAPSGKVNDLDDSTQVPLLLTDEELLEPIELPKIMRRSEAEFLSLAKPVAEAFLAATTVDQILPLVRDRKRVEALIIAYYPEGKIEPIGLSQFNASGNVKYKDSFAAIYILTPDFERKQLAFVDTAEGLKIDWESWVGWSEMPWDKLLESRPTSPVLIRAMLRSVITTTSVSPTSQNGSPTASSRPMAGTRSTATRIATPCSTSACAPAKRMPPSPSR